MTKRDGKQGEINYYGTNGKNHTEVAEIRTGTYSIRPH